jgi:hypothetical protein
MRHGASDWTDVVQHRKIALLDMFAAPKAVHPSFAVRVGISWAGHEDEESMWAGRARRRFWARTPSARFGSFEKFEKVVWRASSGG